MNDNPHKFENVVQYYLRTQKGAEEDTIFPRIYSYLDKYRMFLVSHPMEGFVLSEEGEEKLIFKGCLINDVSISYFDVSNGDKKETAVNITSK